MCRDAKGVVYDGEVKITTIDLEDKKNIHEVEEELEEWVELEEGEELYTTLDENKLEVKKMKKRFFR